MVAPTEVQRALFAVLPLLVEDARGLQSCANGVGQALRRMPFKVASGLTAYFAMDGDVRCDDGEAARHCLN